MKDIYDELYLKYKMYIGKHSIYTPVISKEDKKDKPIFPYIQFICDETYNTENETIGRIEYYDEYYFSVDIYTVSKGNLSYYIIEKELIELTNNFFVDYLGMNKISQISIPNIDSSVNRKSLKYQCKIGNKNKKIIRR